VLCSYCNDVLDETMDHLLTSCDAHKQKLIRQLATDFLLQTVDDIPDLLLRIMLAPALLPFHKNKG
jgi:hypothetical protein